MELRLRLVGHSAFILSVTISQMSYSYKRARHSKHRVCSSSSMLSNIICLGSWCLEEVVVFKYQPS